MQLFIALFPLNMDNCFAFIPYTYKYIRKIHIE